MFDEKGRGSLAFWKRLPQPERRNHPIDHILFSFGLALFEAMVIPLRLRLHLFWVEKMVCQSRRHGDIPFQAKVWYLLTDHKYCLVFVRPDRMEVRHHADRNWKTCFSIISIACPKKFSPEPNSSGRFRHVRQHLWRQPLPFTETPFLTRFSPAWIMITDESSVPRENGSFFPLGNPALRGFNPPERIKTAQLG